jgi:hypothetical protein
MKGGDDMNKLDTTKLQELIDLIEPTGGEMLSGACWVQENEGLFTADEYAFLFSIVLECGWHKNQEALDHLSTGECERIHVLIEFFCKYEYYVGWQRPYRKLIRRESND